MRIALVTGGASGLGLASAKQFARDGMTIVIADLNPDAAAAAVKTLEGSGHSSLALDVSNEQQVVAVFDKIEKDVGPISVVANFAGTIGNAGGAGKVLADASVEDWDKVFAINTRGSFLCIREMFRRRRDKPVENGRVIVIASSAGQMGSGQSGGAYSASKAAVIGLTRIAARDMSKIGVTVNAIAPGPIDTPMLAASSGAANTGQKYTKLDNVPLGRIGLPEEIAAAAAFLASPGASYITGTTIDVNGGLHMH